MPTLSTAQFLRAAGRPADFPPAGPPEVAFAGRSNVGKSSAINALLGRRSLARTSKTPGRTQTINFYSVGERARIADLPGYGYARVPKPLREQWRGLVDAYLQERPTLAGVVLVMDARHFLTALDVQLLDWIGRVPVLALLSKADKMSRREQQSALAGARSRLADRPHVRVALFSSTAKTGVEECRGLLEGWLSASESSAGGGNKKPPVKGI
jgi:GTP-binding protein